QDNNNSSKGGRTSNGFQQKQQDLSAVSTVNAKVSSMALMVHLLNDYNQMIYLISNSFSSMSFLSYYVYLLTLVHLSTHSIFVK
ncbi:unnamed protein product, partial [Rotaria sordida]